MRDFTNPPAVTPVPITDIAAADLNIIGNVGIQSTPVIDQAARTHLSRGADERERQLRAAAARARSSRPGSRTAGQPGDDRGVGPRHRAGFHRRRRRPHDHLRPEDAVAARRPGADQRRRASSPGLARGHPAVSRLDHGVRRGVARDVSGSFAVTPRRVPAAGSGRAGARPAIDAAGNAYFATGNGTWDGIRNFGDSLLKFSVEPLTGMTLVDLFHAGQRGAAQLAATTT